MAGVVVLDPLLGMEYMPRFPETKDLSWVSVLGRSGEGLGLLCRGGVLRLAQIDLPSRYLLEALR